MWERFKFIQKGFEGSPGVRLFYTDIILSPCSCNGTLEGDFRLFEVELQILIQPGSDRLVFDTPVWLAWDYL